MPATDPSSFATDADILLQYPVFADTAWRVIVADDADDTYTVTVLGVGYSFVAVGETITSIRDGLVTALAAGAGLFISVPDGTNAIDILSEVVGLSLSVETSPATLFATTDGFPPEIRACYIETSKCHFNEDVWCCHLFRGHTLVVAHMLKLWFSSKAASGATPAGQTTSMTQGPYSQGWASSSTGSQDNQWWSMSPEGLEYMSLRASLGSVAFSMEMGKECSVWQ